MCLSLTCLPLIVDIKILGFGRTGFVVFLEWCHTFGGTILIPMKVAKLLGVGALETTFRV